MSQKWFIIAGHGNGDPGAGGYGFNEAERVRALGNKLKELGGDDIVLGDFNRNYYKENLIGTIPKDCNVAELHMDSSGSASANGGHIIILAGLTPDQYDNDLANHVCNFFPGRSNRIVGRDSLANPQRAANNGLNYRLIENCFISNHGDLTKYNNQLTEYAQGLLRAMGVTKEEPPRPTQIAGNAINNNGLYYLSHVQGLGDLDPVHDGQQSGTTGFGLRLEGFYLDFRRLEGVKVSAKVHIEGIGWKKYDDVQHDTLIGTKGESKRLEAFEINVEGLPQGKKLKYRTHLAYVGWTPWVEGGFTTGTIGLGKQIEAVQFIIE